MARYFYILTFLFKKRCENGTHNSNNNSNNNNDNNNNDNNNNDNNNNDNNNNNNDNNKNKIIIIIHSLLYRHKVVTSQKKIKITLPFVMQS